MGTHVIAGTPRWEHQLLTLAQEGFGQADSAASPLPAEQQTLEQAYRICEAVAAEHSRSFNFASRFLPPDKRRANRAVYAFCRVTDDIVDEPKPDAAAALDDWRRQTLSAVGAASDPVALAWSDTRQRFRIPDRYAEQLIDGVGRDLQPARYESFDALAHYCCEGILREIEANEYDVFSRRAHRSAAQKLPQLPAAWLHSLPSNPTATQPSISP